MTVTTMAVWADMANRALLLLDAARCADAQGASTTAHRLRAWAAELAQDAPGCPPVAEVPPLPSRPPAPLAAPLRMPLTHAQGGRGGSEP